MKNKKRTEMAPISDKIINGVRVMFTGRRDMDDGWVYEGDVLEIPGTRLKHLVRWDDLRAGFQTVCFLDGRRLTGSHHSHKDLSRVGENMRRIGNIYENPELLKDIPQPEKE